MPVKSKKRKADDALNNDDAIPSSVDNSDIDKSDEHSEKSSLIVKQLSKRKQEWFCQEANLAMKNGVVKGLKEFVESPELYSNVISGWQPSLRTARSYFKRNGITRYDTKVNCDVDEIRKSCIDWISSGKDRNSYAHELEADGEKRSTLLSRFKTFEEQFAGKRHVKSMLSHVKSSKKLNIVNQHFREAKALGSDKLELAIEPGKGVGVRVKVNINVEDTVCIGGEEFDEQVDVFNPFEMALKYGAETWFVRPPEDTTVLFTEYGPYVNSGVPTKMFGEGQEPNVRLAYRVIKRKSVPCLVAKRAIMTGEYLTLSYGMPYFTTSLCSGNCALTSLCHNTNDPIKSV